MKRLRVGVVFGGRSAEHEVSLRSAASVVAAMDRSKYEIVPIRICRDGRWELPAEESHEFLDGLAGDEATTIALVADPSSPELLVFDPVDNLWRSSSLGKLDVIFPVLHGTFGEDGTLQGFLDLAGIPYVGAGTAGSALAMDKALTKSLFRQAGVPVVDSLVISRLEWSRSSEETIAGIEQALTYPLFTKPANLGSSVGVNKVSKREEIPKSLEDAFRYDLKAIVEQGIDAREIEVSVLGNDEPVASVPGEIIPSREFYDYRAKYIDDTSELIIPAPLDSETTERVKRLAVTAFRALNTEGMARVDFLMDRSSQALYVNELNTIPGFTSISMYPMLWEASGLSMPELVDRLIQLAIEKYDKIATLATHYSGADGSSE